MLRVINSELGCRQIPEPANRLTRTCCTEVYSLQRLNATSGTSVLPCLDSVFRAGGNSGASCDELPESRSPLKRPRDLKGKICWFVPTQKLQDFDWFHQTGNLLLRRLLVIANSSLLKKTMLGFIGLKV